jgi:hypothetical protein
MLLQVKRHLLAAGLLAAVSMASAGGGANRLAICEGLAGQARKLPAAAWSKPEPLSPWFRQSSRANSRVLSATERALLADPQWSEELGDQGSAMVFADHLRGTDVYLLESFAGTAHCQSLRLFRAPAGREPELLALPSWLKDGELCVTDRAFFATVLGQPMLVAGGAPGSTSLDQQYKMASWTGRGWGQPSTLSLSLRRRLTLAEAHCAPGASVCEAGRLLATQLAAAYEVDRDGGQLLDTEFFAKGLPLGEDTLAELGGPPMEAGAAGGENPEVPLFGDTTSSNLFPNAYSYVEIRRLAVFVNGTWWWAVVGHPGIGWRETPDVLVTLFALPGHAADAVASYRVHVDANGLRKAAVGR